MCRPVCTFSFAHFSSHKQQEMDILAIYCAVDSEGNKNQYFERSSSLLKTIPTKETPVTLCNRGIKLALSMEQFSGECQDSRFWFLPRA